MTPPPAASTSPQPAISDEALFERFQERGDSADFETLVKRHQSFAYRLAHSVCASWALAEEAVQEAFMRHPRYGVHYFGLRPKNAYPEWESVAASD